VNARYCIQNLGTIRVENTISITTGDDKHRIIYPYFCESPALQEEAARLGLWVMAQCIDGYRTESLTILDVIHSRAYSTVEVPFDGSEEANMTDRYGHLLAQRALLREEYH